MKIDMILVFAVVTGMVAIPYIAFILFGSGRTKKLNARLREEAKLKGFNLEQKENWNGREIGLDTQKGQLLFGQLVDDKATVQHLDLNTINRILVHEVVVSKKIDGKHQQTLEAVNLEFIPKNSESSHILSFYNSEIDPAQNYELNRARKWKELIEAQLTVSNRSVVAA